MVTYTQIQAKTIQNAHIRILYCFCYFNNAKCAYQLKPIQRAFDILNALFAYVCVAQSCLQIVMAQKLLNESDIGTDFQ